MNASYHPSKAVAFFLVYDRHGLVLSTCRGSYIGLPHIELPVNPESMESPEDRIIAQQELAGRALRHVERLTIVRAHRPGIMLREVSRNSGRWGFSQPDGSIVEDEALFVFYKFDPHTEVLAYVHRDAKMLNPGAPNGYQTDFTIEVAKCHFQAA